MSLAITSMSGVASSAGLRTGRHSVGCDRRICNDLAGGDSPISLRCFHVRQHRKASFFRIEFLNSSVNAFVIAQPRFGSVGYLICPTPLFGQRLGNHFQDEYGEGILGRLGNCHVKRDVSLVRKIIGRQSPLVILDSLSHGCKIVLGGSFGGKRSNSRFNELTKFNQHIGILKLRSSREVLSIEERGIRRLQQDRPHPWTNADEPQRFEGLHGFADTRAAHPQAFSELLLRRKLGSRLHVALFNEIQDVINYLRREGLALEQTKKSYWLLYYFSLVRRIGSALLPPYRLGFATLTLGMEFYTIIVFLNSK